MLRLHGKKVICLTTGGLTDEWKGKKNRNSANNCREKSADATVDVETSLQKGKKNAGSLTKRRRAEL
jgi:hypothetical protein